MERLVPDCGSPVTLHPLDVVVLTHDLPAHGLRRGDLGAVVDVYAQDAIVVEFVAASGRTRALVTLQPSDLREVDDDDQRAKPVTCAPVPVASPMVTVWPIVARSRDTYPKPTSPSPDTAGATLVR